MPTERITPFESVGYHLVLTRQNVDVVNVKPYIIVVQNTNEQIGGDTRVSVSCIRTTQIEPQVVKKEKILS